MKKSQKETNSYDKDTVVTTHKVTFEMLRKKVDNKEAVSINTKEGITPKDDPAIFMCIFSTVIQAIAGDFNAQKKQLVITKQTDIPPEMERAYNITMNMLGNYQRKFYLLLMKNKK